MFLRRSPVPNLALICFVVAGCMTGQPSARPSTTPVPSSPVASGPSETAAPSIPAPSAIEHPSQRTLLLDTDVAADDLVALAFLVATPHVELAAITVSGTGEAHCAGGVDVVLRLLERLEAPQIPVACGRETPLTGDHTFPAKWRERVDGGSGLALPATDREPAASSAVELIIEQSKAHADLTVLTTGPLTNLAEAVMADPELAARLGPVFVMGGALHVPGNLVCYGAPEDNDVAEWNVYVDPHSLKVFVDSGVMPSLVSLDGTNQVPLRREFALSLIESAEGAGARVVAELFGANPFMVEGSFYLWDALAAELAAGYPIGSTSPACIVVEEAEGPESGFTRPTCEPANIEYLTTVDPRAAEDTLLEVLNGG